MNLKLLYQKLLETYGPQGWWPIISRAGNGGRDEKGYLPFCYDLPDAQGAYEISLGAVLTQNTSWINAEKAVEKLMENGYNTPEKLLSASTERLSTLIRSAGYYNVKVKKIQALSHFFLSLRQCDLSYRIPAREDLLTVWGIGPETADSILLYSFGHPSFVIDAYTRRILSRLGPVSLNLPYDELRILFESELSSSAPIFNEFHALLVEHAKRHCRKKPRCTGCCLIKECDFYTQLAL